MMMTRDSYVARHFGASITLKRAESSDRQLFLVRYDPSNQTIPGRVKAMGGKIVLSASGWMLAELPFSPAMSLEKAPGFHFVRGVSIDQRRLELFRRAVEGAKSDRG
ncbi:MAG: hypothetical protein NNA21_02925 [Nitrospira sp.]|nr:hypothetical protein [Nitrospira sp.]MCP9461885.1 hypothetical protein [Nitrospira sp.]MCP9474973.1 hypothetical protein [Nitrospira sp.]